MARKAVPEHVRMQLVTAKLQHREALEAFLHRARPDAHTAAAQVHRTRSFQHSERFGDALAAHAQDLREALVRAGDVVRARALAVEQQPAAQLPVDAVMLLFVAFALDALIGKTRLGRRFWSA